MHGCRTWTEGQGRAPGHPALASGVVGTFAAVDTEQASRHDLTCVHQASPGRQELRKLFSERGRARVVLITCGDRSVTTGVYARRILVFADKV